MDQEELSVLARLSKISGGNLCKTSSINSLSTDEIASCCYVQEQDHIIKLSFSVHSGDSLPEFILGLRYLRSLDLAQDEGVFPDFITRISTLKELRVVGGKPAFLDKIDELRNLVVLNLRAMELVRLPDCVATLRNLKSLILKINSFEVIPKSIFELVDLQSLSISSNRIHTVPAEIGRLKNLQTLDLSHNEITAVPPEIAELDFLKDLRLNDNKITSLPPEICTLRNLVHLDLSNNALASFPSKEPFEMNALNWFDLHGNQLVDDVDFSPFTSVEYLLLGGNAFTRLPRLPSPPREAALRILELGGNGGLKIIKAKINKIVKAYAGIQIRYTGARGFTETAISSENWEPPGWRSNENPDI
nr:leucine-rich repeat domain-containing protein [Candidatus Sigynarchaeota archaeon]